MDCSPQGSSVHGILQSRILELIAISSSRGSSQPRDWTHISYYLLHWQAGSLPLVPCRKPPPLSRDKLIDKSYVSSLLITCMHTHTHTHTHKLILQREQINSKKKKAPVSKENNRKHTTVTDPYQASCGRQELWRPPRPGNRVSSSLTAWFYTLVWTSLISWALDFVLLQTFAWIWSSYWRLYLLWGFLSFKLSFLKV